MTRAAGSHARTCLPLVSPFGARQTMDKMNSKTLLKAGIIALANTPASVQISETPEAYATLTALGKELTRDMVGGTMALYADRQTDPANEGLQIADDGVTGAMLISAPTANLEATPPDPTRRLFLSHRPRLLPPCPTRHSKRLRKSIRMLTGGVPRCNRALQTG